MKTVSAQHVAFSSSQENTLPPHGGDFRQASVAGIGRKFLAAALAVLVTVTTQQYAAAQVVIGGPVVSPTPITITPITPPPPQSPPPPITVIVTTLHSFVVKQDDTDGLIISLNTWGSLRAPTATAFIPFKVGWVDVPTAGAMGCTTKNAKQGSDFGVNLTCPFVRKTWNGAYCNNGVANLFCLLYPKDEYANYYFQATLSSNNILNSAQATISFPLLLDKTADNESGNILSEPLVITLADADGNTSQQITTTYRLAATIINAKDLGWLAKKKEAKVQVPIYCRGSSHGVNFGILLGDCHPTKWETILDEVLVGLAVLIVAPFAPIAAVADGAIEAGEAFDSVATFLPEAAVDNNSFIYPAASSAVQ